jgi:hypothetical protein
LRVGHNYYLLVLDAIYGFVACWFMRGCGCSG